MRFLPTQSILTSVRTLIKEEGDVIAAVAYWGVGAVAQTGVSRKRNGNVRILCDLFSGSCNPDEIEKAIQKKTVEVRTLDGLHAKVWSNGNTCIVGSANASINGLGFENRQNNIPNIEAAFITHDEDISKDVLQWFEKHWLSAKCLLPEDLLSAKEFWRKRQDQNASGRAKTQTFLEQARSSPEIIENHSLRILAYKAEDYSDVAMEYWNTEGKFSYSDHEHRILNEEYPFYEESSNSNWYPPPQTVFLDLTCAAKRRVFSCNGLWMVRDNGHVNLDQAGHLIFLTPIPHYSGYRLPAEERKDVARMAKCYLDANDWMENAGCFLDMSFGEFWKLVRQRCDNPDRRCAACPEHRR